MDNNRTLLSVKVQGNRKSLFRKCTSKLLTFGYEEIDVDIPLYHEENAETGEYILELRRLDIGFCDQINSYSMEIQCCDGYRPPHNVTEVFSDVFEFLTTSASLLMLHIGSDFFAHISEKLFTDISVQTETKDFVQLIALRDNIKYSICLSRHNKISKNPTTSTTTICSEYNSNQIDECKKHFVEYVEKTANLWNFYGDYQITLSSELNQVNITLHKDWHKYSLRIKSSAKLTQDVENIYNLLIHAWIYDKADFNRFTYNLDGFCFLPQNISENSDFVIYKKSVKYEVKTTSNDIIDFDNLDGHKFEHLCAKLLRLNGFENVSVTSGSGDQGIDIIAYKDDIKYGIQCKCYHSDIGNKAVQEVYAGKTFYNCHVGIVLTNRDFTRSAIDLAKKDGVILWNRKKLLQMIENCKDML